MGTKDKQYYAKLDFFEKIKEQIEEYNRDAGLFKYAINRIEITMHDGEKKVILKGNGFSGW